MGSAAKSRSLFGNQLHVQLDRHPTIKSVRRLAREMNGSADSSRRMLHDWISGKKKPTRASRRIVAEALGVKPSEFASDEDEEEADLLTALIAYASRTKTLRRESGDPFAMSVLK